MTRAIAQTGYTVGWELAWERQGTACQLTAATGKLDITYTYPQPSGPMTADLTRRWNRFMTGVRKHEQTHGAIAKEMVASAERSVTGLRIARDPGCERARLEAKRRIGAAYMKYEGRQIAFDKREHRNGGNVERLLLALAKGD